MGECVSELTLCRYQIEQIVLQICKRPWIQPISCPGEHDGLGQNDAIGDWTRGPGCNLDACSRCWDWERKSMIVDW